MVKFTDNLPLLSIVDLQIQKARRVLHVFEVECYISSPGKCHKSFMLCCKTGLGSSRWLTSSRRQQFTGGLALLTALWAVIFLEIWKRQQARLACKWDTIDLGYEYEPPRPEYQATAKQKRRHPITREWEPYIAGRSKVQKVLASMSIVTFLLCLAISVIIAVIIFKGNDYKSWHLRNYNITAITINKMYKNLDLSDNKKIFDRTMHEATMVVTIADMTWLPFVNVVGGVMYTSLIGSCINACSIIILEKLYGVIAWYLTEQESPRTMSEFETSYIYKMYVFQFVNYYSLLFYLAFVQPTIQAAVSPATVSNFNDQCEPVGCAFFVTTQLIMILIVKQGII